MKKLELTNIHEKIGGKMIDFAGFRMPIQYKQGIKYEHNFVRKNVGVFDVSHMGEIFVSGMKSKELLQFITTNDVDKLKIGKIQYTCIVNRNGGIIDDCLLYMIESSTYMLVVNASNIDKVYTFINNENKFDCEVNNESDNYSLLAVQGPKSLDLLNGISSEKLDNLKYYNFKFFDFLNLNNVLVSRTGYTGELGFELYVKNNQIVDLWKIIFNSKINIEPIGLAARNTLRLEKGYCLYGNDIDENTTPIEAGLGWITKFNKEFICSEILLKQSHEGTDRTLIGIKLNDKGIARKEHLIFNSNSEHVGYVTSGSISPSLGYSIALGYINNKFNRIGDKIYIDIRGKKIGAEISSLPFLE